MTRRQVYTRSCWTENPSGGSVSAFTAVDLFGLPANAAWVLGLGSAGGTALSLTVTGATGTPSVDINGVACTNVVVVNSTTITCTSPALTVGSAYTMTCGGVALLNAVEVLQSPSTTFASVDFESGQSPLTGTASQISIVTTGPKRSGTHSLEINRSSAGDPNTLYLLWQAANNAALSTNNPNGVYNRFYVAADQNMITNTWAGGQCKLHLARYLNSLDNGNSGQPGWFMLNIGSSAAGATQAGEISCTADEGVQIVTGTATGFIMQASIMVQVVVGYRRTAASNLGEATLWLNGKRRTTLSHIDNGTGGPGTYSVGKNGDASGAQGDQLCYELGTGFCDKLGKIWYDDALWADGYPNPS